MGQPPGCLCVPLGRFKDSESQDLTDYPLIDISDYLSLMPHNKKSRKTPHLCEWMAKCIYNKTGLKLTPSRDDVKIMLDRDEIDEGIDIVREYSGNHGNKPVLMIAPSSTTKNRSLPLETVRRIRDGVEDLCAPALLYPGSDERYLKVLEPLGSKNLRKASAVLYACDAVVAMDSAPLHLVNGAIQGAENGNEYIQTSRRKIIAVCGSSNPDAVTYRQNMIIIPKNKCEVWPCGVHGYASLEEHERLHRRKFYDSGVEGDGAGCICENYPDMETAPCMKSVSSESIIKSIRKVLITPYASSLSSSGHPCRV